MRRVRLVGIVSAGLALAMVAAPVPANAGELMCYPVDWRFRVPPLLNMTKRLHVLWDVDLSDCPGAVVMVDGQKVANRGLLEDTLLRSKEYQLWISKGDKSRLLARRLVMVYRRRPMLVTQSSVTGQVRITMLAGNQITEDTIKTTTYEWEPAGEKKLLGVARWDWGMENDSLVWSRYDAQVGQDRIVEWPMAGGHRLSERTHGWVRPHQLQGMGDFNGVNSDDIVWRDPNDGRLWVTTNGPGEALFDFGPDAKAIPTHDWEIQGFGDFNSDDTDDVLWRHANGQVAIGFMDGARRIGTTYPGGTDPGRSWKVQAVADFDGDWRDDVLWRHTNGALAIWFGGSDYLAGFPTYNNVPNQNAGPEWKVVGAADHDQDGKADIFWRRNDGAFAIWRMNGYRMVGEWYPGLISPQWKFVSIMHTSSLA